MPVADGSGDGATAGAREGSQGEAGAACLRHSTTSNTEGEEVLGKSPMYITGASPAGALVKLTMGGGAMEFASFE